MAHQWFYGLVGSNQRTEPFAGDGMADLLARTATANFRASNCPTTRLDLAITGYSAGCYYETVQLQGGLVLDSIRQQMGANRFWAGRARLRRGVPIRDRRDARSCSTRSAAGRTPTSGRSCGRASRACTRRSEAQASSRPPFGPAPTRRSARSAWGIWRNDGGSAGRHACHVATSHVETARWRTPHGKP